jgi:rod shape-determining protein MreC
MVTARSNSSNPARIPALGVRVLLLMAVSILLMVLDHRQNHLDAVRKAIGATVYPIQIIVDGPFRLWEWIREGTTSRNELQLQLGRLEAERLITKAELQQLTALKAENARRATKYASPKSWPLMPIRTDITSSSISVNVTVPTTARPSSIQLA